MRIGLGCVNLGSASSGASVSDHVRLVQLAIAGGITLLDTADAYGSGASERVVGRAIKGRRDAVTISTKGGYVFRRRSPFEQALRRAAVRARSSVPRSAGGHGAPAAARSRTATYRAQDFGPVHLRRAVEGSLRRLRTDHIDVYQLHGPPAGLDELLGELEDLRQVGKVRQFGVGAESIDVALHWAGTSDLGVLQLPFGLLDPEAASAVFPVAAEHNIEVWARGVLGGGILGAAMAYPNSVSDHPKSTLICQLLRISDESGIRLDELAVRWVAGYPSVAAILLGISAPAHLQRNLALIELSRLPPDVRDAVDAVLPQQRGDR